MPASHNTEPLIVFAELFTAFAKQLVSFTDKYESVSELGAMG